MSTKPMEYREYSKQMFESIDKMLVDLPPNLPEEQQVERLARALYDSCHGEEDFKSFCGAQAWFIIQLNKYKGKSLV
jgi:hypothetical protein